jgi:uncharacterized membrane-anchored protein
VNETRPRRSAHRVANGPRKVPDITVYFWIVKVLTTGMGETTSDYFVHVLDPIVAVALGGIGLAGALALQFAARRYVTWIYWLAVVMVAVFGTMAADILHIGLGIPYLVSSVFFALVLAGIFVAWSFSERTLSIHSIYTPRRETFYWTTVVTTFALGTAVGDMTATTMHLGYFASGVMFAILITVVTIGHYVVSGFLAKEHRQGSRNAVFAFWLAYILTRPLGASFADWLGVSHARGGLELGTGRVSLALLFAIVGFVAYLAISGRDVEREHNA